MNDAATHSGPFAEAVVFLHHFRELRDPRQPGKVSYPLDEVLLCLLGVLAGAECFTEIALFGAKKLGLLRRFRPFKDGTPAHDHLGDILATLDAEQFQACFASWAATVAGVVAVDGKTARRSGRKGAKDAIHVVSAFAARQRLVLGQVKVADKSNEIVAIPKLLDMLAIEGAIDAMARCTTTSNCSSPSNRRAGSSTPRSARRPRSTATMAGSKPAPRPSSATSNGSGNATNGPASKASSSLKAAAKPMARSSGRHAAASPRW